MFTFTAHLVDYRQLYQRYITLGLLIAVLVHATVITAYYTYNALQDEEPVVKIRLRPRVPEMIPQAPPINPEAPLPVNPTLPQGKSFGVPIPVPDWEVFEEESFPTQDEVSSTTPTVSDEVGEIDGTGFIEEDIRINEDPPEFMPVEVQPTPVKEIRPAYPQMAVRIGLEGVVWVKMLVEKDGKVSKTLLIKADSDVFVESALEAAKQWLFTPAQMNNGPVRVWVAVPFRFKLNR